MLTGFPQPTTLTKPNLDWDNFLPDTAYSDTPHHFYTHSIYLYRTVYTSDTYVRKSVL